MAALAVVGCQKVEKSEEVSAGKPFTASMEAITTDAAAVETKTTMDAGGNVLWKSGDQVSIFAGSTINEHYQVSDASDGRTSASLYQVTGTGFVAGGEIPNNVAFYPYASRAEIAKSGSAYVIRDIALPATQDYANASFGDGAFPMTAVTGSTSDYNLKFKNVLGGLKLQLTGTATITSISVTGNNNEKLCGAAEVTVSNTAAPAISLTDATAKTVTLDCGDGVQLNENTATAFIIALPPMTMNGGFTITVTDSNDKQMEIKTTKSQTITRSNLLSMPAVTFVAPDPTPVPAQAVDLGLTSGLKWATCNVGASAPEEYGDYFAWGETEPYYEDGYAQSGSPVWKSGKTGYNWASYKWCNGSYSTQTKYCTNSSYGTVDNNTELDPEDDAAAVNWGGSWRMPTDAEWTELRTGCTWTWTTQDGVNGRLVTGPNGNSIFLPAAGYRYNAYLNNAGSYGFYWSSSLSTGRPGLAYGVDFDSGNVNRSSSGRYDGFSVRPVSE